VTGDFAGGAGGGVDGNNRWQRMGQGFDTRIAIKVAWWVAAIPIPFPQS
jgi:hypothetical protein